MAKTWRNRSGMVQLTGFEELYEAMRKAEKDADAEGKKLFNECAKTVKTELKEKASSAKLAPRLINEIQEEKKISKSLGIWRYEVGWKKAKANTDRLPDTYKVLFFNYGVPTRTTKAGYNRGEIKKRNFIKKAKLSAARKNKKLQENYLKKVLGDSR